jgi:hypothetical protein
MQINMGGSTPKHNKGFEYFKYWLVRQRSAKSPGVRLSWLP